MATLLFLISMGALAEGKDAVVDFRISRDKRSVQKVDGSKILKEFSVISTCGEPAVGKAEIRSMARDSQKLKIVYGKHAYAEIDIATDELRCLGAD